MRFLGKAPRVRRFAPADLASATPQLPGIACRQHAQGTATRIIVRCADLARSFPSATAYGKRGSAARALAVTG
jgi:hypothetical protein